MKDLGHSLLWVLKANISWFYALPVLFAASGILGIIFAAAEVLRQVGR